MKNSEKIKQSVLKRSEPKSKDDQLDNWLNFLEKELKFPFEASIQDSENFELKWKDAVKVNKIEDFYDMYGILLEIKKGKNKFIFPLCDLEVVDKQSKNRFVIEAFLEWWTEKYL